MGALAQVYRLVTCGTVEEKIYRKQVFKGGLSRSSTEDGVQFRYFSQQACTAFVLHGLLAILLFTAPTQYLG